MIIIHNPAEQEEVHVTQNCQFNQLMAHTVKVEPGVTARIYGIIKKELKICKGSIVHLHGRLEGKLKNEGGVFNLYQDSF